MVELREVWIWNEWGHFWPLWGVEGPLDGEELGLSAELDDDLREWHARWEYLYSRDPERQWVDTAALAKWEDEGDLLLVRLVDELAGRATAIRAFRFPDDEAALRQRGSGRGRATGGRAGC